MSNELETINRIDVTGRVETVRGDDSMYSRNGEIILNDLELVDLEALRQIMHAATGEDYYLGREPYEILRDFAEYAAKQYQKQWGRIELFVGDQPLEDLPDEYEDEDE